MLVLRVDGIVTEDDHLLARGAGGRDRGLHPAELLVAERAVPALGVAGAGRGQLSKALGGEFAARVAGWRGEGRHVVAVDNQEAVAAAGEVVIGLLHSDLAHDRLEVVAGDRIIVVAQDEEVRVLQPVIERQDIVIALPVPVDDIAERGDEFEVLLVECLDRGVELPQAVGVEARAAGRGREGRVLWVGDDAELKQRRTGGLCEGGVGGEAGEGGNERGTARELQKGDDDRALLLSLLCLKARRP